MCIAIPPPCDPLAFAGESGLCQLRIAGEGAYRGRRLAGVGEFAHLIPTGCSGLMTHAEAEKGIRLFARECLRYCARSFTAARIDQRGGGDAQV